MQAHVVEYEEMCAVTCRKKEFLFLGACFIVNFFFFSFFGQRW